ncbi:MAG: Na+ dependent nucleoside transporter [Flavobacteriales bacterium]|nr:Na+ dependent nucleoside transporter [Flavobacteriales bacterium]
MNVPLLDAGISAMGIGRGLVGVAVLVAIGYLFSEDKKAINWKLIGTGLLIQLVLAIGILKVSAVQHVFDVVGQGFVKVISFTDFGTDFLFSSFVTGSSEVAVISFAFRILPTIVFFSALTSLLYYVGLLQKVVYVFAWIMKKTMKLSGAESLAAAGNIFLGQTESPFLIKPYLEKMTKSEIMCLMTGGMATIAGGVLAAYIGFLGGEDPVEQVLFAKHLLAASVMSAPAAVVAAKLLIPEKEEFNESMEISKDKMGANVLEAVANGTSDGVKLAVNVGAMLLVFTAFVYMGNWILGDWIGGFSGFDYFANRWQIGWLGNWTTLNDIVAARTAFDGLSFQFLVGYTFAPIAWLMGVPTEDIFLVGQLLGEKTILNEFYAYKTLGEMKFGGLFVHEKSMIMATYILCGFSNFASIGIQIGGIGTLIPNRKGLLSKLGLRALLGGTLACLFTAVLVGMFLS